MLAQDALQLIPTNRGLTEPGDDEADPAVITPRKSEPCLEKQAAQALPRARDTFQVAASREPMPPRKSKIIGQRSRLRRRRTYSEAER